MTTDSFVPSAPAPLPWLPAVAGFGVAWNLYGVYQFVAGLAPAGRAAMTAGMTAAQADVYLSLPAWIGVAFAVGAFGGLIGAIALLMRRRRALPILVASLAGYAALFAGDAYFGVFAAIPSQLAILALVVVVAAVLVGVARLADGRRLLR